MVGKSVSTAVSVAAAKQIFKKAVFCVDNVGTSFNAVDIRSFVLSMAINVISCFEVKPRRRRDEEGVIDDRKAFRLRIRADDQDRLLNANKWPNSIAISEWFFKQPSQATSDKRRRLVDEDDGGAGGAVGGRPQSANSAADMDTEQTAAQHDCDRFTYQRWQQLIYVKILVNPKI